MRLVKYYVEGKNVASIYRERDYFMLFFGTVEDGVLTHTLKDFHLEPAAALNAAKALMAMADEADRDETTALLEVA
jgi:hypothetical protein